MRNLWPTLSGHLWDIGGTARPDDASTYLESSGENSFEFQVTCTKEKLHLVSHGQHCWGYAFCAYLVKTIELVTDGGKEALLEQSAGPLFTQIEAVEYSCWSWLTNITHDKSTATKEYGRYARVRI